MLNSLHLSLFTLFLPFAKIYYLQFMYFSGEDAYLKIRAGASLVQLYTAFAYGGPALIPQIKVLLGFLLKLEL